MAQQVITQLIDDLDGGEATQTVSFGLDGVEYVIDLSEDNAERLRKDFDEFIQAARRVGRAKTSTRSGGRKLASRSKEQLAEIRRWAQAEGYPVAVRGRIKQEIVEAWELAHAV
jgi:hypothetical protein